MLNLSIGISKETVKALAETLPCIPAARECEVELTELDAQQIMSCIIGNALWWLLNDILYAGEQMVHIMHWLSISGIMAF